MADICQRCISTEISTFDKFIHFVPYFRFSLLEVGHFDQYAFNTFFLTGIFRPLLPRKQVKVFIFLNKSIESLNFITFSLCLMRKIQCSLFSLAGKYCFADIKYAFAETASTSVLRCTFLLISCAKCHAFRWFIQVLIVFCIFIHC